jgi:uncharacterized membrane protein YccF (DUF307 family)
LIRQTGKGLGSSLGNVLWFILGGWWLALMHVITGVLLCLTIIGIPLGLANLKLHQRVDPPARTRDRLRR